MARYVVLSFAKNEDAEAFITHAGENDFVDMGGEVIALIAQPTLFHGADCPGAGKRVRPWARGEKWGWWICNSCHKPAPPMGKTDLERTENLMRQTVSQGVNLLEGAANKFATVFDRGWGALGRSNHQLQIKGEWRD